VSEFTSFEIVTQAGPDPDQDQDKDQDQTPETTGPEVPGTGEENWEGVFGLDD
jgi:hypothetical protein